ncbi:uncharacterized protein LOC131936671 isoform X2 [Physella acuta]|uniref:uncharacterized protein LOC131936671 isoform X2 n=1 Tax=Physella acuta TaxID=109671 RepID=UPI0027DE02AB|nr:uncharacterized protein LOC131936671 isoform X2 [Physella acuta]
MQAKLLIALFVVVAVSSFADADKGEKGKGGPGGDRGRAPVPPAPPATPRPTPPAVRKHDKSEERNSNELISSEEHGDKDGAEYTFGIDLGNGVVAEQQADVPTNGTVILVKSNDPVLASLNITRARSIYSFYNNSQIVAVIVRGACFVSNTDFTYQSAIDHLNAINNTNQTITKKESWNATKVLSRDEAKAYLAANPDVRRACNRQRISLVEPAGAASEGEVSLTFYTLDTEVTAFVLPPPPKPTHPAGGIFGGHDGPKGGRDGPKGGRGGRH